jgi:hypothetical protein
VRARYSALNLTTAQVRGCELPDAKAETLGPDEYGRLEAFLEQGEAVVEVAGRKVALVMVYLHRSV